LPFIFITSFVVALSGALIPGPLLALTVAEVTKRGFWAGPILVLGHAIAEIVVLVALARGVSELMGSNLTMGIIGLVGGVILAGMGVVTVKKGRELSLQITASPTPNRPRLLVLSGALASVCNPYFLIWWATIGVTYLVGSLELGIPGVVSFYSGHILGDLGWYSLVSMVIASGKRVFNNRVYHGLLMVCGVALLGLGVFFVISGVRFIAS